MGSAARFQEVDVKRAMSGAAKSGVRDFRINLLPDGTISIIVGSAARKAEPGNSCDDLLP